MAASPLVNACVVLVRTQGPINLGMVARLCGNLGITDLRLVAPQCEVDCAESRMFSTHSRELMLHAPVFATLSEAVADRGLVVGSSARFREKELGASHAPHEVPRLLERRPATRYALVFGNEADGLSDDELRCCQAWVHLETFGPNNSYNLANACAITLYAIATAMAPSPPAELEPAADRAHVDDLFRYWLGTLDRIQYFRRTEFDRFAPQLSRFIGRLHLTVHDVQVLRGMLAQMNYFAFGERGPAVPPASGAAADGRDTSESPAADGAEGAAAQRRS